MPKRAKEGGGGGENKKKKQVGLAGCGKTFIKAGKWDKYKGTYLCINERCYLRKEGSRECQGEEFSLLRLQSVGSVVCLSANQESKTKVKALCGLLLLYFRPRLCLLTLLSFTFVQTLFTFTFSESITFF